MPHGDISGNALVYSASEVAEYLTCNNKEEYPDVLTALGQFFNIPENSWRKRGNPASGGPMSYIGHFWVACQVLGIAITPRFEGELKDARWRARVEELPEIEKYWEKLRRLEVRPEKTQVREEIIEKTGKRTRGGITEVTEYYRRVCVEEGYVTLAEAKRRLFEAIIQKISAGRDMGPFTRYEKDTLWYITSEGRPGLLSRDQLYERLKNWFRNYPTLEDRMLSIGES